MEIVIRVEVPERHPETGAADSRLVERIAELEAALKDAQHELSSARQELGVHAHSELTLGISALRVDWEASVKDRERLEGELVEFARLWREFDGANARSRAEEAARHCTALHAKAERLSPSPHGHPSSGAPSTEPVDIEAARKEMIGRLAHAFKTGFRWRSMLLNALLEVTVDEIEGRAKAFAEGSWTP